jgi:hypothetical protein
MILIQWLNELASGDATVNVKLKSMKHIKNTPLYFSLLGQLIFSLCLLFVERSDQILRYILSEIEGKADGG